MLIICNTEWFNFLVDIGTFRSPHDITNILDQSRSETIISPSHLKQVIKSIEKVENKTSLQVKNNEDLRSKYNKLQEDNISLTDLMKPIPQDEVTQVKEKFSARNTSKEGMVLMIYRFSLYFLISFVDKLYNRFVYLYS